MGEDILQQQKSTCDRSNNAALDDMIDANDENNDRMEEGFSEKIFHEGSEMVKRNLDDSYINSNESIDGAVRGDKTGRDLQCLCEIQRTLGCLSSVRYIYVRHPKCST